MKICFDEKCVKNNFNLILNQQNRIYMKPPPVEFDYGIRIGQVKKIE